MGDMDEFVDMFKPAAPKFWVPVGHKHDANADSQKQQREWPQLFHELHSDPPRTPRTRDNFSTAGYFFRENARLQNWKLAIRFLNWNSRVYSLLASRCNGVKRPAEELSSAGILPAVFRRLEEIQNRRRDAGATTDCDPWRRVVI